MEKSVIVIMFLGFFELLNARQQYVQGEAVIKFKTPFSVLSTSDKNIVSDKIYLNNFSKRFEISNIKRVYKEDKLYGDRYYVVKFPLNIDVKTFCDSIKNISVDILSAQPNYIYCPLSNDPYSNLQWGLTYSKFNTAWTKFCSGTSDVLVAIMDSGVDLNDINGQVGHPDLQSCLWINDDPIDGVDNDGNGYIDDLNGYDFINSLPGYVQQPNDDSGVSHGTAVAGIIGAITNNGIGVSGAAGGGIGNENGVKLMIVKVLNSLTRFSPGTDLAAALRYAWENGADVVNFSLGGIDSDILDEELGNAVTNGRNGKGCIVVGGSGNAYSNKVLHPASDPRVIAVGAVRQDGTASDGNYGHELDVVAPGGFGEGIYTTARRDITNGYAYFGGTSASAPFVSALAALILSIDPNFTWGEVHSIIKNTASGGGERIDDHFGYGIINAENALNQVQSSPPIYFSWQNYNTHPRLSWQGDDDADMYNVFRKIEGGSYHLIATTTNTYFVDIDVTIQTKKPFLHFVNYFVTAFGGSISAHWSRPSDTLSVQSNMAEGHDLRISKVPEIFQLSQNFPNPFNPVTKTTYSIPENSFIKISIFDDLGRIVTTLVEKNHFPGNYEIPFDARDFSSGVYYYKIESEKFNETKKMVLIK